ncbi:MAG: hypothetical protein RIB30_01505 [Thalassospira sp.]|uniref:hypothetical protein n=1 Tax=Thalassospira sp. TaxID=1912094 RepID=UPI0032EE7C85
MKKENIAACIPLIGTTCCGILVGAVARGTVSDWTGETLTAGILGVVGGSFALYASKKQIEAQREILRNETDRKESLMNEKYLIQSRDFIFMTDVQVKNILEELTNGRKLDYLDFRTYKQNLSLLEINNPPDSFDNYLTQEIIRTKKMMKLLIVNISIIEELSITQKITEEQQHQNKHKEQETQTQTQNQNQTRIKSNIDSAKSTIKLIREITIPLICIQDHKIKKINQKPS